MPVVKTAAIAVENSTFSFDKAYDYLLKDNMQDVKPGCRVLVPFGKGNSVRQGIVMRTGEIENPSKRFKYIASVIDTEPVLNDEMLNLVLYLKERTFCTLFDAVKAILPAGMCHRTISTYTALPGVDLSQADFDEKAIYDFLMKKNKYVEHDVILKAMGIDISSEILKSMTEKGYIAKNFDSEQKMSDLTVKMVRLTESGLSAMDSSQKLTTKQKEVLRILSEIGSCCIKEICYFTGFTSSVVLALEKKGYVEIFQSEIYRNPYENVDTVNSREEIILSSEQQNAYDELLKRYNNKSGDVSLLFGVTGSGKTSVYMKLIDSVVESGRQVIVMVPEISLTPQTLNLFHKRYGRDVAVIHSQLSAGQRMDEFKRIKNGEVKIVVGTRSAVFAPFDKLGMIIIDEEQEHTYKSEQTPRYNAKEVAKFRCNYNKALLLLASATPSIETYAKAEKGLYSLSTLNKRYSKAVLPEVCITDMYTDALSESEYFSKNLADRINYNLQNNRQSILLMNRRGYNTFVSCKACGHVITCPSCSISMTYHHANNRLMCHYCGYSQNFTDKCPECGSNNVRYAGVGTQKIEDEIQNLFPDARVVRMDADSTMSKNSHEDKLKAFAEGKYDILLGTQMVAKGLDFENVTLVGVINADQQLNNDDFRSQERTFDLLTQVVGRAGRGQYRGSAVIQTFNPENEVIEMASKQDYKQFFKNEIQIRKMLIYPPFCDICLIGFVGTNEAVVKSSSKRFFELIKTKLNENYKNQKLIILGPMAARVSKISNKFRYRIILKCKNSKEFRQMIGECLTEFSSFKYLGDTSVYVDINPENIL